MTNSMKNKFPTLNTIFLPLITINCIRQPKSESKTYIIYFYCACSVMLFKGFQNQGSPLLYDIDYYLVIDLINIKKSFSYSE